jgi:predicted RNA-binding protein YlqC (UPF0109 family)
MKNPNHNRTESKTTDILDRLVKGLVQRSKAVRTTTSVHGSFVAIVVKTDQDDVRRVIGKQGKHIKAIQVIAAEAGKRLGIEMHVALDENSPTAPFPTNSSGGLGSFDAKEFRGVKQLLKDVVSLFVRDGVTLTATDIGTTCVIEVKIKVSDFPALYGKKAMFDYGTDGHIIGAIKNIFDGLAKNRGRSIKLIVTTVGPGSEIAVARNRIIQPTRLSNATGDREQVLGAMWA